MARISDGSTVYGTFHNFYLIPKRLIAKNFDILISFGFIWRTDNSLVNPLLSRHPISQFLVSHPVDPQIYICQTSGSTPRACGHRGQTLLRFPVEFCEFRLPMCIHIGSEHCIYPSMVILTLPFEPFQDFMVNLKVIFRDNPSGIFPKIIIKFGDL